jgi:hypothetical protein
MVRYVAAFAAALLVATAGSATAESPDVLGGWQLNIDCGLLATATNSMQLAEDGVTGALTGHFVDFGTFEVPDAIRRTSGGHDVPDPIPADVTGTQFTLPAAGFFTSDATVPAFPIYSCNAATEIISTHRLTGTITADPNGRATGVAGTWENGMVDARDPNGVTCWAVSPVPSCKFDMRRNDLPVGDDLTVSPRQGTTVTFEHVTAPGTVGVMPLTDADGGVPAHFEVLGTGGVPIFYDVHTSATFEGTVTTCFSYPDENGDGLIDGSSPPLDETDLRILHEENGTFVDRTVRLDTEAKVICGATTSLSEVAVARVPGNAYHDQPWGGGSLLLRRRRSGKELAHFVAPIVKINLRDLTPDPRETGAVVELFSVADRKTARFEMSAATWRAGRTAGVFRFRNPGAPNATSSVASAVLDYRRHHVDVDVESRAVGLPLDGPQHRVGVRLTLGVARYCFFYQARSARRDGVNHFVGRPFPSSLPGDCADRRIWFALSR